MTVGTTTVFEGHTQVLTLIGIIPVIAVLWQRGRLVFVVVVGDRCGLSGWMADIERVWGLA